MAGWYILYRLVAKQYNKYNIIYFICIQKYKLMFKLTCKSATKPPLKTQGSWSPLIKLSFHPFENPKIKKIFKLLF